MGTEAKGRFWTYILRSTGNEICDSFLCVTVFLPPSPSLICTIKFASGEYLYMVMWACQNGVSTFELTLTYCPYCAYSCYMQCLQIFSCPWPVQHASVLLCLVSQHWILLTTLETVWKLSDIMRQHVCLHPLISSHTHTPTFKNLSLLANLCVNRRICFHIKRYNPVTIR